MVSITTEYISVGGNRHPAAADWDVQSGVLAFGADNNVALWDPRVSYSSNICLVTFKMVVVDADGGALGDDVGELPARGLFASCRPHRQGQCRSVLHMPFHRSETSLDWLC